MAAAGVAFAPEIEPPATPSASSSTLFSMIFVICAIKYVVSNDARE